jgi:hypothetical protein
MVTNPRTENKTTLGKAVCVCSNLLNVLTVLSGPKFPCLLSDLVDYVLFGGWSDLSVT